MREPRAKSPLPSFDGWSRGIGRFLAGLEQKILHDRPPPPAIVEEDARSQPTRVNGLVVDIPEPDERPEPPDTTGAVL